MVNRAKSLLKTTLILSFLALTVSCSSMDVATSGQAGLRSAASEPVSVARSRTPQIEDTFAPSSLWQGQVWRVYIKGSDPDGDMDHIWVSVTQLGGNSATDLIPLKGEEHRAFAGYMALHSPRSIGLWETVRVEVKIKDKAGNCSPARVIEAQIGSPTRETLPQKWAQVAERELGTIFFHFEPRFEGKKRALDMFRRDK